MPNSSTKKSKNHSKNVIVVESEEDAKNLKDKMKGMVVAIVFIHADWCGHCQTFKPLWEEYKKMPGRNTPMIEVNDKVRSHTPFASANIEGFPSNVIYSPNDNSFATFKNESGKETHSIPNIRDKVAMSKLLKTDPKKLMQANTEESETLEVTPAARKKLTESGKRAVKHVNTPMNIGNESPTPPNTKNDIVTPSEMVPNAKKLGGGGALFETIVRYIKGFGNPTRRRSKGRSGTRKAFDL